MWIDFFRIFSRILQKIRTNLLRAEKIAEIFEKIAAIKSLLNLHFKGFGAITRSDSCRSCFSVHFRLGIIAKCWIDDHFVKILMFFPVFSVKKVGILDLFWLAACRRRFFFGPNSVSPGKGQFSSAGGLPQALFFLLKMTVSVEK